MKTTTKQNTRSNPGSRQVERIKKSAGRNGQKTSAAGNIKQGAHGRKPSAKSGN